MFGKAKLTPAFSQRTKREENEFTALSEVRLGFGVGFGGPVVFLGC